MTSGGTPFPNPDQRSASPTDVPNGGPSSRPYDETIGDRAGGVSSPGRTQVASSETTDPTSDAASTGPDDASGGQAGREPTTSRTTADGSSPSEDGRPTLPPTLPARTTGTPSGTPTASHPPRAIPRNSRPPGPYLSDGERRRRLYRRANPWYLRLTRTLIGLALLAALAAAVVFAVQTVDQWQNREQLPAIGATVPTIGSTTILINASPPSVDLAGMLTIDTASQAFQFIGTPNGRQAGMQAYSLDGATVLASDAGSSFTRLDGSDVLARDLRTAVAALVATDSADAVLTDLVRRDFVDLDRQATTGVGDLARTRYELSIDTSAFAAEHPLQWETFRTEAIVGAIATARLPVALWLDTDDVLVQVSDTTSNWSWERLSYDDDNFVPDPAGVPDAVALGLRTCPAPDGGVEFFTALASCDEAVRLGSELAVAAGVSPRRDSGSAAAFTTVCAAIQNDDAVITALLPANVELARRLDAAQVCPGDLSLLESSP